MKTNKIFFATLFCCCTVFCSVAHARYYDPMTGRFMSVDPVEPSIVKGNGDGARPFEPNPNDLHSINRYSYGNNNPYRFIDPNGKEVVFQGDPASQALKPAYESVKTTPRGELLGRILERSPDKYTIRGDAKGAAYYLPATKTIYLDPNYHPDLPTTAGQQPGPTDAVLGHEMGHAAIGTGDRGPGRMDNINKNENPIRDALGYPRRTGY